jgi:hypothetical protein
MDFSKWRSEILHEIECLVFHNYFIYFGKKKFIWNSRFPVRSVLIINISLFTSVVCYCQNGLRRKHGKCSLCNEWWHSFMNQRLNHLVLLYRKCNCIRIMSLNTYNENVDLIWHYCITIWSYPKSSYMVSENGQLLQIWRKTHWSIWLKGYDMTFFISHAISTLDPY